MTHSHSQIDPMFPSEKDKETMIWLYALEEACSGTTIFVHRLSAPGEYLCQVPCTHKRFSSPDSPVRYCGCYDCMDMRTFRREYMATGIIDLSDTTDVIKR